MKGTKVKSSKGITLVALVITIIILLILAIVAINAVSGDGIIGKAQEAGKSSKEAQAKESIALAMQEWKLANAADDKTDDQFEAFLKSKFGEDKVSRSGSEFTVIIDGYEFKLSSSGISEISSPAEGVILAEGIVRANGLIYKIIDNNSKTVEVYGDRGDIDYTSSQWIYNDIVTTGDVKIDSEVVINGTKYKVTKVAAEAFSFSTYIPGEVWRNDGPQRK